MVVLIRGGLLGSLKRCPVTKEVLAGWEETVGAARPRRTQGEVSRCHSTGGDEGRAGKGRTHEPEGHSSCSLGRDDEGSQPQKGSLAGGDRVKPEIPRQDESLSPATLF